MDFIKVTGITYGRMEDKKITEKANFDAALNKMRNNFNSWNQRDLTILGRVMLAKYHGIALLQYLAGSIEVPAWAIQKAKKMIYRFVYKGVDKIKRTMASKPVGSGGINLPILDDITAAAAVQWLRKSRVTPERIWAKFIHQDVNKLGGLGCLNALRRNKDNEREGILAYNQYLMKCWQHLKKEEVMNETTFLSQTVWKNGRFSYSNNKYMVTLLGKYLMKKGYTRVGDFFDQDGRVIEAEGSYTSTFSLRAKMEWALATKHIKRHLQNLNHKVTVGYSNADAIPEAKNIDNHEVFLSVEDTHVELAELTQGRILRIVAERRKEKTPYLQSLMDEFNINEEEISKNFKNVTQVGYATKTRSFFFKLYAGLLYGNKKLHLFGYAESIGCERCEHPVQDLSHLLIDCPVVRELRKAVYTKIQRNFSKREEMLGCDTDEHSFILLHLNKYIYQRKFLKLPLNPYDFYAMLKMEEYIERTIAVRSSCTVKNNKKWDNIHCTGILL